MKKELDTIIKTIGDEYREKIADNSRHYLEINIGSRAEKLGYSELKNKFKDSFVLVPLKSPMGGMRVRIDGRTFVDYAQFESGIAAPGYVAKEASLPHRSYTPNDSMILNFT